MFEIIRSSGRLPNHLFPSMLNSVFNGEAARKRCRLNIRLADAASFKIEHFCSINSAKHTWLRLHKPELVETFTLIEFEKHLLEQGNEVEALARQPSQR